MVSCWSDHGHTKTPDGKNMVSSCSRVLWKFTQKCLAAWFTWRLLLPVDPVVSFSCRRNPSYILAYDCSTATQVSCDLNTRCSRALASLSRNSRPTCAKGKTGKSGRSGHLTASWMPTSLLLTQCRVSLQSVSYRHFCLWSDRCHGIGLDRYY
jgi:hypothetical protein